MLKADPDFQVNGEIWSPDSRVSMGGSDKEPAVIIDTVRLTDGEIVVSATCRYAEREGEGWQGHVYVEKESPIAEAPFIHLKSMEEVQHFCMAILSLAEWAWEED